MFALYITHPQVRIDPSVPVPEWGLSDIRCGAGANSGNPPVGGRAWLDRFQRRT